MKRINWKWNKRFLFVSALLAGVMFLNAQGDGYKMNIELNDGSKVSLNTSDVKEVSFADGKIVVEGSDIIQTIMELSDSVEFNSRRINNLKKNYLSLSDSVLMSFYYTYYCVDYLNTINSKIDSLDAISSSRIKLLESIHGLHNDEEEW